MITSMTGFGSREAEVSGIGKIRAELRSANHKFLDTVFHLPEGLLFLEDKIKKEIEARIKRGRITCVIAILSPRTTGIFINKPLLKEYIGALKNIKQQFKIKDELSINTLIHLPGVLSPEVAKSSKSNLWPDLKCLVGVVLDSLIRMRQKEGRALCGYLKNHSGQLENNLEMIEARFKKAIKEKLRKLATDEERSAFLKETDITEELERLAFHIRNFQGKLLQNGAIGKELDFIAQEMQREANTIAAKSFDAIISAHVIQVKSQIEKIREQVQNIE